MSITEIFAKAPVEREAFERWTEENLKPVKIKPPILHPGIAEDAVIRRFVDLPKLLDLLVNQRLLLPQLGLLTKGDPFECSARRSYEHFNREELVRKTLDLRFYAPKSYGSKLGETLSSALGGSLIPVLPKSRYEEAIEQMPIAKLRQAVEYLERRRLERHLACSCWYMGDGTEFEDAMWKIFCGQLGASITTSVSLLKACASCQIPKILADSQELRLEKVIYRDDNDCKDSEPWLIKRTAFKHESEVRLYIDYPFSIAPGFYLDVDPTELIDEIVITPFAEDWQRKAIRETCEVLLQRKRVNRLSRFHHEPKISESTHLDAAQPKWPEEPSWPFIRERPLAKPE